MTRIFLLLAVAAVAVPAYAAESANVSAFAKGVREGAVGVGSEYSTNFGTGRFHKIHVAGLGLNCETCHAGSEYQPDFIALRLYEDDAGASPGKLDRGACLGCHKSGGPATTFYSGRATK